MKWIRGLKSYDTDTADELFEGTYTYRNESISETLYRTPKGALFIADSNSDMRLVEVEEVKEWLERFDAPEDLYVEVGIGVEEG